MRHAFLTLLICFATSALFAQRYAVVNTETIFQSMSDYTAAQDKITTLQEQYQQKLQTAYDNLEAMFQQYQNDKGGLTAAQKKAREQAILDREDQVKTMQETYMGQDGELAKQSETLFKPVQEKVQAAIEYVAKAGNYDLVMDVTTSMGIMYFSNEIDISQQVIQRLRNIN